MSQVQKNETKYWLVTYFKNSIKVSYKHLSFEQYSLIIKEFNKDYTGSHYISGIEQKD